MAETMKDYEKELNESMKKIEEGDILTGTVVSVDEKEVILDLKYYAEGVIPAEDYTREPGFNLKEEVHPGDEVSATVVRKDDGNGNILLSRVEAADVLAWEKIREYKESGEALDVTVKGITNAGVIAYVEGVRGFIPASRLSLGYVEDTEEYLNRQIRVQDPERPRSNAEPSRCPPRFHPAQTQGKYRTHKKRLRQRIQRHPCLIGMEQTPRNLHAESQI